MISYDIAKLTRVKGFIFTSFVSALIIAPGWYIYQFYPNIFYKTELFKLLIICIGVGLPGLFILSGASVRFINRYEPWRQDLDRELLPISLSGCYSSLTFYTPCAFSFYRHVSQRESVIDIILSTGVALFILLVALPIFSFFFHRKKRILPKLPKEQPVSQSSEVPPSQSHHTE